MAFDNRISAVAAVVAVLGLAGCATESGGNIRTYAPWFTSTYKAHYQSVAACAAREMQKDVVVTPVYVDSEKRVLLSAAESYRNRYGENFAAVWEAEIKQIDATTAQVQVKRTVSPNENSGHWQRIRDAFDRCGGQRLS